MPVLKNKNQIKTVLKKSYNAMKKYDMINNMKSSIIEVLGGDWV